MQQRSRLESWRAGSGQPAHSNASDDPSMDEWFGWIHYCRSCDFISDLVRNYEMTFALYLKSVMAEQGIKVSQIAKRTRLSYGYINNLLHGHRPVPTPETMNKIALAINCNQDQWNRLIGYALDRAIGSESMKLARQYFGRHKVAQKTQH